MDIKDLRKQVADSLIDQFGNKGIILLKEKKTKIKYFSLWKYKDSTQTIFAEIRDTTNPNAAVYVNVKDNSS